MSRSIKAQNAVKFVTIHGRPVLYVPCKHQDYCDKHKFPLLIVWKRRAYADVTWLNETFQIAHYDLWQRQDFRNDIECRAESVYQKYAANSHKSDRAVTDSVITLYELTAEDAEKAACDLFDMVLNIIDEYKNKVRCK
ncbi:hypothetical protein DPU24_25405 [Salmonella enterica subsp. enterica serovar Oranienburg]|nr:hypothetical protein [Salmonella enterica subsp. enterica serovar Oranienburg]HAK8204828.1 hypothetical protein [Salmonella enterica]